MNPFKHQHHRLEEHSAEKLQTPPSGYIVIEVRPPRNGDVPATLDRFIQEILEIQSGTFGIRNHSPVIGFEIHRFKPGDLKFVFPVPTERLRRKVRLQLSESIPGIGFAEHTLKIPVKEGSSVDGGFLHPGREDYYPLKTSHDQPPANNVAAALHRHTLPNTGFLIQILFQPFAGHPLKNWYWVRKAYQRLGYLRKTKTGILPWHDRNATPRERKQADSMVRRLVDGDTASSVLAEFLGVLDGFDLDVTAVYLDREFYDSKCLTLLQAHNYAYLMPIVRWGETIKQELSEGWSRVIEHDLTGNLDGHSWTVEFPVYIDCTYQNGRYDEHRVARHGYAAEAPFIDSPRAARYHYAKRFGIEASYRLSEQSIATTSTQDPVVRLLYVVVSLLLQNVWRYLHWEYVATPRRGGRRLWQWSFKEFINMVCRAAWKALAVRRAVPANRPLDDRFCR